MTEWLDPILPHWPFLAAMFVFNAIGQVLKRNLFTRDAKPGSWRHWGYRTLTLHPVAAGIALAFIPGIPASPGIELLAAKALYFATAGVFSTWAYSTLKQVLKKQGIEIEEKPSQPPTPLPESRL